MINDYKICRI
uniref:Uncharacterized protein n=1 Tax=Arundo donax TaxID=35708 RepID=A0A0A8YH92_ARUDO